MNGFWLRDYLIVASKLLNEINCLSWGCDFQQLSLDGIPSNIHVCLVKVNTLTSVAVECVKAVADNTWISRLDPRVGRGYTKTVNQTAQVLSKIFSDFINSGNKSNIGADFGEIMVSIGSAAALSALLQHNNLPVSELWKPQVKQNEGFDFHTQCSSFYLNFGEAKFSDSDSPHGDAIPQIKRFIEEEKHLRDRVHLINLAFAESIDNLDEDKFGAVVAFSINAKDPEKVLRNAATSAFTHFKELTFQNVYIVGVVHK